jgi:hypothetical protein
VRRCIPAPTGEHLDTLMSDGRNAALKGRLLELFDRSA